MARSGHPTADMPSAPDMGYSSAAVRCASRMRTTALFRSGVNSG